MSDVPSSWAHILHFPEPWRSTNKKMLTVWESVVKTLNNWFFPIDQRKLATMSPDVQRFFELLRQSNHAELHIPALELDLDAFLIYWHLKSDIVQYITLPDFLSAMSESHMLLSLSWKTLKKKIKELFRNAEKSLYTLYFSPNDFLDNIKPLDPFLLPEYFFDPIFSEWEYFYTIKTGWDTSQAMRVNPKAILEESISNPDLTLLVAWYLEQIYADGIITYPWDTPIELIRYDYRTGITSMAIFSLDELEWYCITEIRDRNPLLIEGDDPSRVIKAYIDRTISSWKEATIHKLR